jgi:WD40 repeat protein
MKAYPFLVSSSQKSDFTTVVAPEFICKANISYDLLKKAVARYNQPTELGTAIYLEIPRSEVGKIFLVFRTTWASERYIGGQEDKILRDLHRPIPFIEGVVLREPISDNVVASINLEIAHQELVKHYQDFWKSSQPLQQLDSFDFLPKDSDSSKHLTLVKTSLSVSLWRCRTTLSWDSRYLPSICSVAFSPDGKIIATRYDNQIVKLWDWREQKVVKELNTYESKLSKTSSPIAFNPQGNIIATGLINKNLESIINIWELRSNWDKIIEAIDSSQKEVYGIIFHNDCKYGNFLVTGVNKQVINLLRKEKTKSNKYKFKPHSDFSDKTGRAGTFNCLAVSRSGKFLGGGDNLGNILLWNFGDNLGSILSSWVVRNIQPLCLKSAHSGCVNSVAFSPKDQRLASGSNDGKIKIWQIEESKNFVGLKEIFSFEANSSVKSVSFSPTCEILASGSDDNLIRIWDLNKGKIITTLNEHKSGVNSVTFSVDGLLASGSQDGTVKVWNEDLII